MIKSIQPLKIIVFFLFIILFLLACPTFLELGVEHVKEASDGQLSESLVAGAVGEKGYKDGYLLEARFDTPHAFSADSKGNVYVADTGNNVIRKISSTGIVTTWAGNKDTRGFRDGHRLTKALFDKPTSIVINKNIIYIADSNNHRIRKIVGDIVSTVAGGDAGYQDNLNGVAGVKFENPGKLQLIKINESDRYSSPENGDWAAAAFNEFKTVNYYNHGYHEKYGNDHIDISLLDGPNANRWRVIAIKDDTVKEVSTIDSDIYDTVSEVSKNKDIVCMRDIKGEYNDTRCLSRAVLLMPRKDKDPVITIVGEKNVFDSFHIILVPTKHVIISYDKLKHGILKLRHGDNFNPESFPRP